MTYRRTIVLGGGLTGLSAAWRLAVQGQPVTLIEKAAGTGGLAQTIDWDGWKFDLGPHNFHSANHAVIAFYQAALGERFLARRPRAALYFRGKALRYPLKGLDVFTQLGAGHSVIAAVDFLRARANAFVHGIEPTEHFDEWIIRRFGRTLFDTYFGPYVERVWRIAPHNLSSIVGERRIPVLSIRGYLKRELLKVKPDHPEDVSHYDSFYPIGGIGTLAEYFLSELRRMPHVEIRLGEAVTAIRTHERRIVAVETSRTSYDTTDAAVVSTLPIEVAALSFSELPPEVASAAAGLDYCPERFLMVRIKRPAVLPYDWTYFAGREFVFNRVMELRAEPFKMAPEGHCSLTFELPANMDEREWHVSDDELIEQVLSEFRRLAPLDRADVIDYRSVRVAAAYPKFRVGYDQRLREVFGFWLQFPQWVSAGRQGLFCYINTDEATDQGFTAADGVLAGACAQTTRQLLQQAHSINC